MWGGGGGVAGRPFVWRSPQHVPAPCGLCAARHRVTCECSPAPTPACAAALSAVHLQRHKISFCRSVCSVHNIRQYFGCSSICSVSCNVRKHFCRYVSAVYCNVRKCQATFFFCCSMSAILETISLAVCLQCQKIFLLQFSMQCVCNVRKYFCCGSLCSVSATSENIFVAVLYAVCLQCQKIFLLQFCL